MNEWTRIFFREQDQEFDRSHQHTEKPVWLFAQSDAVRGVRPGVMYQYADVSIEPREFFRIPRPRIFSVPLDRESDWQQAAEAPRRELFPLHRWRAARLEIQAHAG